MSVPAIARQWVPPGWRGCDPSEVNNSAIALAVADLALGKDKVFLATGPGYSPTCTGRAAAQTMCTVRTTPGCWRTAPGTATVRAGGDTWFFLTADYAFGHAAAARHRAGGGGSGGPACSAQTRYPFPQTTDYSSFLLQAQASPARRCSASPMPVTDTVNSVKQAHEFGPTRRMKPWTARLLGDARAMGAEAAQGLLLTEPSDWDLHDCTRAFTQRVLPCGCRPTSTPAPTMPAPIRRRCTTQAAAAMGPAQAKASGRSAIERMKALPTEDDCFGSGRVREDGRKIHPVYLFEVNRPPKAKKDWDLYRLVGTIEAEQAMRPLSEGGCPLVRS